MSTKQVFKQLAVMEDLLTGVGKTTQHRNDNTYNVTKIDAHYGLTSEADLQDLAPETYSRARVYESPRQYVDYIFIEGDTSGIVVGSGSWVKINNNRVVLASDFGVGSDGADYTAEMQELFDSIDETTDVLIDSTNYSLSLPLLINNGFNTIKHLSNSVVNWLGAGLDSTTAKAIFSINLDEDGFRTNEDIVTATSADFLEDDFIVQVNSAADINPGNVLRINKHICRVVRIDGNNVYTDRTTPVDISTGAEVSILLKPNIGSLFEGPSLIKFAPDNTTQVYGFGVIAALCYDVTIRKVYGLHNASRLAELFYCADSLLEDVFQYEPTDVSGGGQSYAARVSNGNDNRVEKVRSFSGRHCVDITFSHRNFITNCDDYYGQESSYLTHFNGCKYNIFDNCNMWFCSFGVYLSADNGDFNNTWQNSVSYNSRAIYRPVVTSFYKNLLIVTTNTGRDIIVPRGNPGIPVPSVCNLENCHLDLAAKVVNVDTDYTVNMYGGSYKNTRIDGLFRAIASGTPGSPSTVGQANFNFYNVDWECSIGQGRNNINAKILFKDCIIRYDEQPFGEDCGDQRYVNCDITCTNVSAKYLVTVGSGNNCELIDCTLRDVQLPFRYFAGYPSTGTITFGANRLLGSSTYAVSNLLANMNWQTVGYASLPIARKSDGNPVDGTVVYWDSNVTTDPFKSKRVGGSWVDWIV